MQKSPHTKSRKCIRLQSFDYSQPGAYFITLCTYNHVFCFGEIENGVMQTNDFGKIAQKNWLDLPSYYSNIFIDEWCVMPNHFHGILFILDENNPIKSIEKSPLPTKERRKMLLPKIIGRYKMTTSKAINIIRNTPGKPFWQRNYYEHIIRNEKELNHIREYIQLNVLKWEIDRFYPKSIEEKKHW